MTVMSALEPSQDWLQRVVTQATRTPVMAAIIAGLGLLSAMVTYLIMTNATPIAPTTDVVSVLIVVNFALVLLLAALIIGWMVRLWVARRSGSAGARLHGRFVMIFGPVSYTHLTLPTILRV